MTADLHSLRVLFSGVLTPVDNANTTVTPLLTTSDVGTTWTPSNPFELQMLNPEAIRRAIHDGSEPLMLACRITGPMATNYPDGLKGESDEDKDSDKNDDNEAQPETPTVVHEAAEDAVVLVFADVDMISDMVAYQEHLFGTSPVGDNASLVLNAVDYLSGSGDLIAIRSRGQFNRPFTVVDAIEAEAEKATASEVEAINAKIKDYREKLRTLGRGDDSDDKTLIRSKAVAEREKIQEEIRMAEKELRHLNAGKREKIETLKASLQTHNMVWASAVVLMIAIVLAIVRAIKAKRYAARRIQE